MHLQKMVHLHTRIYSFEPRAANTPMNGHRLSHVNHSGFFICRAGRATVENMENLFTLEPGDVYIYLPSMHACLVERSPDFEGYMVETDISYILPYANRTVHLGQIFSIRYKPLLHLSTGQADGLARRIEELRNRQLLIAQSDPQMPTHFIVIELYKALVQTIFYELIFYYFDKNKVASQPHTRGEVVFQQFVVSLSQHYKSEREVSFYAREQNIAPRYFSQIVHKTSGCTPLDWIVKMVIAEATQQLELTDLSIKEIAQNLNFCSQTFFGKYFKQYMGMSPSEYRKHS